jgi:hypothetical protein
MAKSFLPRFIGDDVAADDVVDHPFFSSLHRLGIRRLEGSHLGADVSRRDFVLADRGHHLTGRSLWTLVAGDEHAAGCDRQSDPRPSVHFG